MIELGIDIVTSFKVCVKRAEDDYLDYDLFLMMDNGKEIEMPSNFKKDQVIDKIDKELNYLKLEQIYKEEQKKLEEEYDKENF